MDEWRALHEQRLALEAVIIGHCDDCDQPVTALDKACRSEIRERDGTEWTAWYHAACVGCDEDESTRWAGCPACGREWLSAP